MVVVPKSGAVQVKKFLSQMVGQKKKKRNTQKNANLRCTVETKKCRAKFFISGTMKSKNAKKKGEKKILLSPNKKQKRQRETRKKNQTTSREGEMEKKGVKG